MAFQTLDLDKKEVEIIKSKRSFWKRQFQLEATGKQRVFDGIFGIFLPVMCFLFDPIVFKGGGGSTFFGGVKPFVYIVSFVSIMSLLAFMLWGAKLKGLNGFLCGLFGVAGVISLTTGVILFPFSLMGLVILIGVLGFTPLFTAFVYLRNAVRAYKISQPVMEKKFLFNAAVFSAILAITLPIFVNLKIERGLQTMRNGDAQTIRATAKKLRYVAPLVDFSRLRGTSCEGKESEKHKAIVNAFEELTGKSLNNREYMVCNDF